MRTIFFVILVSVEIFTILWGCWLLVEIIFEKDEF